MKPALILSVFIFLLPSCVQRPSVQEPVTYEFLAENFNKPPQHYGVDCWWWWLNGHVTREAITSDLEAMKGKGFYGAMIFDAGGYEQRGNKDIPAGPVFGSSEWRKLFVHALDEAERLGLEMGFNIQSGWNLGGPCITEQYAAKALTYSQVEVTGGMPVTVTMPQPPTERGFYRDVAAVAFPIDENDISAEPVRNLDVKLCFHELGGSATDCRFLLGNDGKGSSSLRTVPYRVNSGDVRDISGFMDPGGEVRWDCPSGKWIIMRIGYTCTGAVVSTHSAGWDGLVLDYLSRDAFRYYIDTVVEPILADAGHYVGTTLKFMETDSWECGGMNWTDGFENGFRSFNGYDILPYLPVIGGYVVDGIEESNAFLADFRKTVADAIAVNHYGEFARYARSRGMGIQPESAGPHAGPFDGIRNYSFSDITMSEFWAPSPHRPRPENRFFVKQAASAAHIYGKRIVGAESFTTIGPHWNDRIGCSQKPSFDHEICSGLNRVYFHTFTCSPAEMGLPGQEYFAGTHVNPRVTWWKEGAAFTDYLSRVQMLVQDGRFCADVLYYYGDHIPNIHPLKQADMAGALPGYDYDVTGEEVLLNLKVDSEGRVAVPTGLKYRVLVLPDHRVLSLAVLRKVEKLLKRGATVIGGKPEKCVSLKGGAAAREEFRAIADRIWGDAGEARGSRKYGRGKIVWGVTAHDYLESTGIVQDFTVAEDCNMEKFDYIHYTVDGRELYFISYAGDSTVNVNCTFRAEGRRPELWDAVDASIKKLDAFSQKDGLTTVPLHFEPYSTAAVLFNEAISTDLQGTARRNWQETETLMTIDGPWNVYFDPEWGGPGSVVFDELADWTASGDDRIRYYSGAAVYTKTFSMDGITAGGKYHLVLGDVMDTGFATVTLNGTDEGVTWTAPFMVDVTDALREGENLLEIKVVNSWFNRVAGDEMHPDGKTYTSTNIVLGHDFRGAASSDIKLSPSGLMGPVKVIQVRAD